MPARNLIFRVHAIQRMFERRISVQEVRAVLDGGQVIETYADDFPYPSRLMLGFIRSRPIHVVAADRTDSSETVIITVYEPDARKWDPSFSKRQLP